MRKLNKMLVLSLSAAAFLSLGIIGVDAYADKTSKEERLAQMEKEFKEQEEALNKKYTDKQEEKVKDLSWEVGKLKKELHPEDPEEVLKRKLSAFKQMTLIHENSYKGENVEDVDFNDPKVIKVLEAIEKRKQLIERMENELSGNAKFATGKSAQELLEEFEQEKMKLSDTTKDTRD
ncbi:hypothetical protein E8L90_21685 [Brevibacillus antibioticus]|uniref:Uncharacterized protein n=1 Tax=Brevibacillus antibioticus TaxID=2570228 RepID=A0A4U2YEE4_9BACL|nr:hypothetical protein [Brevibacillus antibioticus]TKI57831.1 hypothetical protein E8L90_21685 [Brevibacillus antibioticus]